jgi:hypothetical protein
MIQINLPIIQAWLFKNWSKVALIITLLLLLKSCQGGSELSTAKNEIENYKKKEKEYVAQVNKLEYQKKKFIDTIKDLNSKNFKKFLEIIALTENVNSKISDIKHYNSSDIAKYYKDRYKLPKEVKTTNLGTALTDTVAKLNITDLVLGDGAKIELKITKEVLGNTQKIVTQKDSIITNVETQNNLLFLANKESDKAFNKQQEVVKSVEKSLRSEKNKKTFWRSFAIGASAYAGYLLIANK